MILRFGLVIIMGVVAGLIGCKTDGGDSNPNSDDASAAVTSVPIFASKEALPKCTKDNDTAIAYVADEKAFFICDEGKWKFQSARGEDGLPGAVVSPIGDQWRKVWKKLIQSSVYIESKYTSSSSADCPGVRYESGSGYIVEVDTVITNGHVAPLVLEDKACGDMALDQVRVWYPVDSRGDTEHTTRSSDCSVYRVDRSLEASYDTLILDVSTGQRKPMPLSTDGIAEDGLSGDGTKLNDDVLQMGFSGGTTFPHFATGKITQIAETENRNGYGFLSKLVTEGLVDKGVTVLEYDLISGSGASGGAVIDLRGLVVGTNFAGNSEDADTEFGYAIPVDKVNAQLEEDRDWDKLQDDPPDCQN